ncbi:amidase signature enzyme [Phaeosphaeriaceae sp. SRC1lsM3a]|nr:amidase signature enzyme [Stagonospora sp. SRC1lsM3a]
MRFNTVLCLAAITEASTVLQINSTSYYSPDLVTATLQFDDEASSIPGPLPATYLSLSETSTTVESLRSTIEDFLSSDDVFSEYFLSTVVLGGSGDISDAAAGYLRNMGCGTILRTESSNLMPGPYMLHASGAVTKVYRLYWDHNFAFVESVTEGPNGTYIPITGSVLTDSYGAPSIAVPSRLYYPPPTEEKPLSGKRLGVKDIYDLKGIRTSGGNRAYRDLVEPAPASAPALQKLIDMGAVVIGKTKTTQFALGERPTADYVDQLAPFNPRGDGYQHPQGSSAGTGAGLASYEWMDIATGSDTGGSVRLPAMANGLFGMRITNTSLPLSGILPISAIFDTPGVLARSAKLLQAVHKVWFPSRSYTTYPKRVIIPEEFWPTTNQTSMPLFEAFIDKLATFLEAEKHTMSLNASFDAYANTTGGLSSYIGLTYSNITNYDQYRLLAKPFKDNYQAKFGKSPYWNPQTHARWTRGATLPFSSYQSATERYQTFGKWYRSTITPSCESSLVLYPMGAGTEDYRDSYPSSPPSAIFGSGLPGNQMSVMAALPDYTVPIGERTYYSRVTERNETLPVSIGIVAAQGCDQMLMDLVADLSDEGIIVGEVKTGTSMY